MKKSLFVAAALIVAAPAVFAQSGAIPAPNAEQRIEQRQANQARRIEQGETSGALTQREANRLEKRQARVEKMEQKAAADGTITGKEAAHVQHAQNVESRRIARQKHDRQHDYNHDGKMERPRKGS